MTILLNGTTLILPDQIKTISDLLHWKQLPRKGAAVALNSKFIPATMHESTFLKEMDDVSVITAAYGG